jgi:bombesin receptor subtype-3
VPFTTAIFILDSWPWGETICKFSEFSKDLSTGVSVFTLTALSGDRYFAIVDPLRKFHSHSGRRATRITIGIAILIWVLATIMGIPALKASYVKVCKKKHANAFSVIWYFFCSQTITDPNSNMTFKICYPFPDELGPNYPKAIVMLRFSCYYAIPLTIIGVFYVLIAINLIHSAKHVPGELQGAQRQVITNELLSYQLTITE